LYESDAFTGLVIEEGVNKAGLSGIVRSELRVTITDPNFYASDNAEVSFHIDGYSDYPAKFFINKREISGSTVKLTCRSKLYRLDCTADFTENDFDNKGQINFTTALSRIAAMADLDGFVYFGDDITETIPKLHKNFLYKANCMSILEKLSAALCGTFREHAGALSFCRFEDVYMENVPAEALSPIKSGLMKRISRVVMTGGGQTYSSGFGGYTQTVRIKTPFASQALANTLAGRLTGKEYRPYVCESARISGFPLVGCTMNFDGVTAPEESADMRFTNHVKIYPSRGGLYCYCACNAVNEDEWDYSGELERGVAEKIAAGERFGSTTLLADGNMVFESAARREDEDEGFASEIKIDDDDGFIIKADKARLETTETMKLSGERMDIETPLINLPPDELLTEHKDLIGALNELFTAGSEGGDELDIYSLLAENDLWQAVTKAHRAHYGTDAALYVMGFKIGTTTTLYSPTDYYGVRVIPNTSMQQPEVLHFNVRFHIYAGMDSVEYIKSGVITFRNQVLPSDKNLQIANKYRTTDSLGGTPYGVETYFDHPVNMVVVVFENNSIEITSTSGEDRTSLINCVFTIPPGMMYTNIRRACIYPAGNTRRSADAFFFKDLVNNVANGQVRQNFPYDIFGCDRDVYLETGGQPTLSLREIQYMINKRNGVT
jgi:hypothetical protein